MMTNISLLLPTRELNIPHHQPASIFKASMIMMIINIFTSKKAILIPSKTRLETSQDHQEKQGLSRGAAMIMATVVMVAIISTNINVSLMKIISNIMRQMLIKVFSIMDLIPINILNIMLVMGLSTSIMTMSTITPIIIKHIVAHSQAWRAIQYHH